MTDAQRKKRLTKFARLLGDEIGMVLALAWPQRGLRPTTRDKFVTLSTAKVVAYTLGESQGLRPATEGEFLALFSARQFKKPAAAPPSLDTGVFSGKLYPRTRATVENLDSIVLASFARCHPRIMVLRKTDDGVLRFKYLIIGGGLVFGGWVDFLGDAARDFLRRRRPF